MNLYPPVPISFLGIGLMGRFLSKSDPRTSRAADDRAELLPRWPDQESDQGSQRRPGSREPPGCHLAPDATGSTIVCGSGGFGPGDARSQRTDPQAGSLVGEEIMISESELRTPKPEERWHPRRRQRRAVRSV